MINTENRKTKDGTLYSSYNIETSNSGEIINKRYEIIGEIGQGGFGTVYKVKDIKLNTIVAIKIFHKKIFEKKKNLIRLQREINVSRKIKDHSKLLKIHSLEESENIVFLVMEFVEGMSLERHINEKKKIAWEEFKPLYLQILEGVKTLHDFGIIHRDLKPSNIILKNGQIKLLDFGLSKELDDTEKTSSIGEIVGSPDYMSPEQITQNKLDFRSDIYQLGIILYKALSGSLPFDEDNSTMNLIFKRINSRPKKLTEFGIKLPKYLEFGIGRALERNAENRFNTISEMIEYFEDERYPFLGSAIQGVKKSPKTTISAVLVLALLILLSYFYMSNNTEIGKVEYNGSNLKVYNPFGTKLFEKNFESNIINFAGILDSYKNYFQNNFIFDEKKCTFLYLSPKVYNFHKGKTSFTSNINPLELIFFDKKGKYIFNFKENKQLFSPYQIFANSYYIEKIKKLENNHFLSYMKQSSGMYPSAYYIIGRGNIKRIINPGRFKIMDFKRIGEEKTKYLITGINNLLSHTHILSEITTNETIGYATDYGGAYIPNLSISKFSNIIDFIILPPSKIKKNYWFKSNGYVELYDIKGIDIIKVFNNYKIKYKNTIYFDNKENLKRVYDFIDSSYKEKILKKDNIKAESFINSALNIPIENPWLKSILYNYKGDINVAMGRYDLGLKFLKKSLEFFPDNVDSLQRFCDIYFLSKNYILCSKTLNDYDNDNFYFWGLEKGNDIYKIYLSLYTGKLSEAKNIYDKISNDTSFLNGINILDPIINIINGKYRNSLINIKQFNGKRPTPFTINEFRLIYLRSVILYSIFNQSKKYKEDLELIKFYINDISINAITINHLVNISKAFFLAKEGKTDKAKKLLFSGYEELLKMNKGDFFTRFWFFYDMFIYGKTNEILGNISEAKKGYKKCIKANPYTNLAKKAKERLITLEK